MTRIERWVAWMERRHRAVLWGAVLLAIRAGSSLFRLRLDLDLLDMLPRGAPAFDDFRSFVADFGQLDELIILVEGDDPSRLQHFAEELSGDVGQLDTIAHVQGRFDPEPVYRGIFGRYLFNYLPLEAYAELEHRLTPEGMAQQIERNRAILRAPMDLQAAQLVRRDPLGLIPLAARSLEDAGEAARVRAGGGWVSSDDGKALLIIARPSANAFDIEFSDRLMAQIRRAEANVRARLAMDDIRVGYTGSYAYAVEDAVTIRSDVRRYTLLALAGVLAVFWAGYRSFRILPFVTLPLVLSTLLTFAVSVLWYDSLNAVSTSFAAILYGLSIDSGIHYYTRLIEERQGRTAREAVTRTLTALAGANFVASTTTAAVFAIIGFSALRGISQLGTLTAVGMLINVAVFFVIYPALSFWLMGRRMAGRTIAAPQVAALAAASARRSRPLLIATALVAVVGLVIASGVGFESDLTRLRPGSSRAAQTQARVEAVFGGSTGAGAVLVRAPDVEAALRQSERIEDRLRHYVREGQIAAIRTVSGLLPSERTQRERLARFARLDGEKGAADLRKSLAAAGFVAQPFEPFLTELEGHSTEVVGLDSPALEPFTTVIARHLRERAGAGVTVGAYIEPAPGVGLADIERQLREDLPDEPFLITGRPLLEEELGRRLRSEVTWFFIAALGLNVLIVFAKFRRLQMAVATLAPPLLVVVLCLAAMREIGHGIGPVNLIVIPLILGIGVDNCVYFIERFREAGDIREAAHLAGRALVISALTTMAGFGFLGLSEYPALAELGWLTAVSLFFCLLASLTVLPALLVALGPVVTRGESRDLPRRPPR